MLRLSKDIDWKTGRLVEEKTGENIPAHGWWVLEMPKAGVAQVLRARIRWTASDGSGDGTPKMVIGLRLKQTDRERESGLRGIASSVRM